MRCDEVFEHLTRAGGQSRANGRLERHLAECGSCRELAELFGPAVALFERGGADEEGEVPAAWGRVWEAVGVAERAAAQVRRSRRTKGGWQRYGWPACTAAALLIGVMAGVVVGGGGAKPQAAAMPRLSNGATEVSCDLLLAVFREAAGDEVCPVCRRPIERQRSAVVSLCAVCHLPQHREDPAGARLPATSSDGADDTVHPTEAPTAS
jgi:hypothetical protein